MSDTYCRWADTDQIPLLLQLADPSTGLGLTGKTPEVSIRRHRASKGGAALDDFYWDGAGGFTATPTWLPLTEYDAINNPGLYLYLFKQPGAMTIYLMRFRHTSAPEGFFDEQHLVSDEIQIPASSPVVPVVPGDTVMGRLAAMEDPTGAVALANADAVWDEPLADHLAVGSTGEALSKCSVLMAGSRQIDVTVEDGGGVAIQGAQIDVRRADNSFLGRVFTDVNGEVSINLDDGPYLLYIFAAGFTFTVPENLLVAGDAAVTYTGSSLIVITPPSAPDLCVIFGTVRDAAGQVVAGACVEAFAITPQVVGTVQKGSRIANTVTDANGQFQMELVRLTNVRFAIEGTDVDFERVVPDAASQDLTTWT